MTTILQLLDRCNIEIVVTFADGTWTAPPSENLLVGQARLAALLQRWPLASVETRQSCVETLHSWTRGERGEPFSRVEIAICVHAPTPKDLRPPEIR